MKNNFCSGIWLHISAASYASIICILGLSYGTDDYSLREAFTNYGEVVEGKW